MGDSGDESRQRRISPPCSLVSAGSPGRRARLENRSPSHSGPKRARIPQEHVRPRAADGHIGDARKLPRKPHGWTNSRRGCARQRITCGETHGEDGRSNARSASRVERSARFDWPRRASGEGLVGKRQSGGQAQGESCLVARPSCICSGHPPMRQCGRHTAVAAA